MRSRVTAPPFGDPLAEYDHADAIAGPGVLKATFHLRSILGGLPYSHKRFFRLGGRFKLETMIFLGANCASQLCTQKALSEAVHQTLSMTGVRVHFPSWGLRAVMLLSLSAWVPWPESRASQRSKSPLKGATLF